MALCASKTEFRGQVETARLLINRGAVVNSHDRYVCGVVYHCNEVDMTCFGLYVVGIL